jgi:predicted nucleic acid-binding protein
VIVVDSSLVFHLFTQRSERIERRLEGAGEMIAPALLDLEVASMARRFVLEDMLTAEEGEEVLVRLGRLPVTRYDHLALLGRIWDLRGAFTVYDAAYVALAEHFGATLLTIDERLASRPELRCPVELIWIG